MRDLISRGRFGMTRGTHYGFVATTDMMAGGLDEDKEDGEDCLGLRVVHGRDDATLGREFASAWAWPCHVTLTRPQPLTSSSSSSPPSPHYLSLSIEPSHAHSFTRASSTPQPHGPAPV
jgi:hypothetical protein